MKIIEEMIEKLHQNKDNLGQPRKIDLNDKNSIFKKFTQEELDKFVYRINNVHIATLANVNDGKATQDKIVVAYITGNWYMDIKTGKYYEKGKMYLPHNQTQYIQSTTPFEYVYGDVFRQHRIPNQASLPAWCFVDIFDKTQEQENTL